MSWTYRAHPGLPGIYHRKSALFEVDFTGSINPEILMSDWRVKCSAVPVPTVFD
jgi:hypothetical protein